MATENADWKPQPNELAAKYLSLLRIDSSVVANAETVSGTIADRVAFLRNNNLLFGGGEKAQEEWLEGVWEVLPVGAKDHMSDLGYSFLFVMHFLLTLNNANNIFEGIRTSHGSSSLMETLLLENDLAEILYCRFRPLPPLKDRVESAISRIAVSHVELGSAFRALGVRGFSMRIKDDVNQLAASELEKQATPLRPTPSDEVEHQSTPDGNATLRLMPKAKKVLACLANSYPDRLMLVDIQERTSLSKSTVQSAVEFLQMMELADRPEGERKGVCLTNRGKEAASNVSIKH